MVQRMLTALPAIPTQDSQNMWHTYLAAARYGHCACEGLLDLCSTTN